MRASTGCLKASRLFETRRSLPHTFPSLHKRDRDNDARETSSDRVPESCDIARWLCRSDLTGNKSNQGASWPQTKAARVLQFVSPPRLLRQNVRPRRDK